jgi:hypothetical protein
VVENSTMEIGYMSVFDGVLQFAFNPKLKNKYK